MVYHNDTKRQVIIKLSCLVNLASMGALGNDFLPEYTCLPQLVTSVIGGITKFIQNQPKFTAQRDQIIQISVSFILESLNFDFI